jgi:hypothetical protein
MKFYDQIQEGFNVILSAAKDLRAGRAILLGDTNPSQRSE